MEIKRSPDVVRPVEVAKKAPKWPWVLGVTLGSIIVLGLGVLGYVMYSQRMQPTSDQVATTPTNEQASNVPTEPSGRTVEPTPDVDELTKAVLGLYNDPLNEDDPFTGPLSVSAFDLSASRPKATELATLDRAESTVAVSGTASPNGQFVALLEGEGHVWLVDLSDGTSQEIANDPAMGGELVWSPDSDKLVWQQASQSATALVSYDVASGETETFQREDESDDNLGLQPLAWRGDELFVRRGAINTEDPGDLGVVEVSSTGDLDGKFSKLFDLPIAARGMDISPDGRMVVLARGSGEELGAASEGPFVVEVLDRDDGNSLVELRRSPDEGYTAPLFTPDGDFLVYAAASGLWRYNLDGSGDRTQLVATDAVEEFVDSPDLRPLSIQPDGSRLVFSAVSDSISRLLAVDLDAEEAAADDLVELTGDTLLGQSLFGWTE